MMFFILLFVLMLCPTFAWACTTIVVGRSASTTNTVLVAHNEDNPGRLFCSHDYVPPREGDGRLVRYEDGAALIHKPTKSLGFYWCSVREERGHSASDRFVNDRGVCLVTNNCRESRRDKPFDISDGGVWYALRRAVAEGARTAYHGLLIATTLLNRYGYRDSGRTYTIADSTEAWILQIAAGKAYAAVRLGDSEVALIPNHYTLRSGDLRRPHLTSPNLIEEAVARGWHRSCDVDHFDFARAYQDPESWRLRGNVVRHINLARALGAPLTLDDELPFALRPKWRLSPKSLWLMLADHYEGTEFEACQEFGDGTPHQSPDRRICTETTHDSSVFVTDNFAGKTGIMQCPGRPCTYPYFTTTLEEVREGLPPTFTPLGVENLHAALDDHCRARPELLDDGPACHKLWDWATAFNLRYNELRQALNQWKTETQEQMEGLTLAEQDRVFAKRGRDFFEEGPAAPVKMSASHLTIAKGSGGEVTFTFPSPGELEEGTIRCGQSGLMPHRWAKPLVGSLVCGEAVCTVKFRAAELAEGAKNCKAHFFLTGRKADGRWFVGTASLKVEPRAFDELIGQ